MTQGGSGENRLYRSPLFPSRPRNSNKRFSALISIGANLGNRQKTFHKLFQRLLNDRDIDIIKSSALFINPDYFNKNAPKYLNAAILIKTNLAPFALLNRTMRIEKRFGRTRPFKNAPRTLDIDLIFFETKRGYNPKLLLPHPKWRFRAGVLLPMLSLQGNR